MSQTSVEGIDSTVQQTNEWLKELCDELHMEDRQRAYLILRAFLQVTRDQLRVDEAAQFAAQLPMLLRGVYYEGWVPSQVPERLRDRQAFLDRIRDEAVFAADMDPARAVAAASKVVLSSMSEGQEEQILRSLPGDIRELMAA